MSGVTAASAVSAAGLRADRDGNGWRVSGETPPVLGAAGARILVLGAATGDGGTLWFVLDAEQRDSAETHPRRTGRPDPRRGAGQARRRPRLAPIRSSAVEEDRVRDLAAALFAAEAAGVARWCQQTGLGYAKVREQFGVPIGSFQAVKHKCARLFARTELITAAAWDAAVAHGQDGEQFALAAAAAAVIAAPAAVDLALETVTLLGGIGYTWEHDVHLYWRRAMSLAALLGPRGGWQRRLAGLSGVHRAPPRAAAGRRVGAAAALGGRDAGRGGAAGRRPASGGSWPNAGWRRRTTRGRTASAQARPPRW